MTNYRLGIAPEGTEIPEGSEPPTFDGSEPPTFEGSEPPKPDEEAAPLAAEPLLLDEEAAPLAADPLLLDEDVSLDAAVASAYGSSAG
ncbi:MAG: hypothetical protein NXI22_21610 [bacterium]|nr:hypothetical protein [bacterium]